MWEAYEATYPHPDRLAAVDDMLFDLLVTGVTLDLAADQWGGIKSTFGVAEASIECDRMTDGILWTWNHWQPKP
jgi:hypothetical protein